MAHMGETPPLSSRSDVAADAIAGRPGRRGNKQGGAAVIAAAPISFGRQRGLLAAAALGTCPRRALHPRRGQRLSAGAAGAAASAAGLAAAAASMAEFAALGGGCRGGVHGVGGVGHRRGGIVGIVAFVAGGEAEQGEAATEVVSSFISGVPHG